VKLFEKIEIIICKIHLSQLGFHLNLNMNPILTTRYNNETWQENYAYKERLNHRNGCLYGSPRMLTSKIPRDSPVFVVEMNNSTNKILGIGLISNRIAEEGEKYFNVYNDRNWNRFVFKGKYRIDREIIELYNPELVQIFDHILFKGKTHLKRGSGFTSLPIKLTKQEICNGIDFYKEIKTMFKRHFSDNGEKDYK